MLKLVEVYGVTVNIKHIHTNWMKNKQNQIIFYSPLVSHHTPFPAFVHDKIIENLSETLFHSPYIRLDERN